MEPSLSFSRRATAARKTAQVCMGYAEQLVLAGAQTQVTSLWNVSDKATRSLMTDFYQRFLNGEKRLEALSHVQLTMLARPELSHP